MCDRPRGRRNDGAREGDGWRLGKWKYPRNDAALAVEFLGSYKSDVWTVKTKVDDFKRKEEKTFGSGWR